MTESKVQKVARGAKKQQVGPPCPACKTPMVHAKLADRRMVLYCGWCGRIEEAKRG